MSGLSFFLKGLLLGISIAAPVGPIGILCIRRTLEHGFRTGFCSGLGAASADGIYGSVAAWGLVGITEFLTGWHTPLRTGGGVYLAFLGIRSILSPHPVLHGHGEDRMQAFTGLAGAYFSTFLLTISNPMTILSFSAIFASLGQVLHPAELAGGVFLGSVSWWLLLCWITMRLEKTVSFPGLPWITRCSGIVLLGFAASVLLHG